MDRLMGTAPVAVVGGGLAGTVAALELAEAGVDVDLFEAADDLLTGASYWCEGKVHLGFVYAMDSSMRTARTMVDGASSFARILSRYVPEAVLASATSAPFVYAVPIDSMLPTARVVEHFERVDALLRESSERPRASVRGREPSWRRLGDRERAGLYDADRVVSAFQTAEVAIDPRVLAPVLRAAVRSHDRIATRLGTPVRAFRPPDENGAQLVIEVGGVASVASYRRAVNAAWSQRLALDATARIPAAGTVMHRYKVGLHGPALPGTVPSTTFIVGSYGDVVRFADRSYQSWYPAGLVASHVGVEPPGAADVLGGLDAPGITTVTAQELARLMPGSAAALRQAAEHSVVAGGWITAWGSTDIDDPGSRLHERHEIGVSSYGPHLSIDTGKYTTAPHFAAQAARRVLDDLGR